MNYPVWDVPLLGGPWIIGLTSILHVIVSHFAVGGGAYLYFTELKAVRENDEAMRAHVRRYTKFFYYLTTVFGAVSGVGIWFAIGLVSAPGTSALIHAFVFAWATEWVFFMVEIAIIIVYHYGWDCLDRETHLKLARSYFIVSVMTLVVINGILCFMLTPGRWIETRNFWHGFFNPTYFPALFIRLFFMFGIAGMFGIAVATRIRDNELLRTRLVRFSAGFAVPLFLAIPFLMFWFLKAVPADVVHNMKIGLDTSAPGTFSTLARMMIGAGAMSLIIMAFTFIGPYLYPRSATTWGSVLLIIMAGLTMGMSEYSREAARKPFVIYGYMYSNGILVSEVPKYADGFLSNAKWAKVKSAEGLEGEEQEKAGREMFRYQCMACHTTRGYRGLNRLLGERDREAIGAFLDAIQYGSKDNAYKTYMPPFLGSPAERDALAAYLATLNKGAGGH